MLNFFEDDVSRLPKWCKDANDANGRGSFPFCQLLGEYIIELPGYNTIEPYAHMNENCPSLPPDYFRPEKC